MVYRWYIYSIHGDYNPFITGGAPPCKSVYRGCYKPTTVFPRARSTKLGDFLHAFHVEANPRSWPFVDGESDEKTNGFGHLGLPDLLQARLCFLAGRRLNCSSDSKIDMSFPSIRSKYPAVNLSIKKGRDLWVNACKRWIFRQTKTSWMFGSCGKPRNSIIPEKSSFLWMVKTPSPNGRVMASIFPLCIHIHEHSILVGGFNPSEKYESQLGWWDSQYMGK